MIVPLCKGIVRPHLEYCIQDAVTHEGYYICLKKYKGEQLKSFQSLEILASYEEILKECGLTTQETRRLRGSNGSIFKILNGHENIDPNIFFLEIKTCKHDYTLGQSRMDVRKYSFSQRTVNEWNKLSGDCVHSSSSITMFKNTIDNYLLRRRYTIRFARTVPADYPVHGSIVTCDMSLECTSPRTCENRVKRNYNSFYFRADSAARAVRLPNQSAADT